MFASIKSLIPEPRHDEQPRRYVGRHRHLEVAPADRADHAQTIPGEADPVPVGSAPPAA